jgi:hypothetical protein
VIAGDGMILASACEVRRHEDKVVLVLKTPSDEKNIAAVMSPREARHLLGRLGKASNDAASYAARATPKARPLSD